MKFAGSREVASQAASRAPVADEGPARVYFIKIEQYSTKMLVSRDGKSLILDSFRPGLRTDCGRGLGDQGLESKGSMGRGRPESGRPSRSRLLGMMSGSRVLLVSSNRASRDGLIEAVREIDPVKNLDIAMGAFEAVRRLAEGHHGAAVCVVDDPDDLGLVIRLKKARRDLPVVMMTSIQDPTLSAFAEQMGADLVLRVRGNGRRNAEGLLRILKTSDAIRRPRTGGASVKDLVCDVRRRSWVRREFIAGMLGLAAACDRGELSVLIVEDSDADYLLLSNQLKKSGLPPCSLRVSTGEEALGVLRGEGRYADRSAYPRPSLVVSDLKLPGMSGLELLRRLRRDDALKTLGFILHTSSERPEDSAEAARWGANFYVVKSIRSDPVVEILHGVFARFIQERTGFPP